MTDSEIKELIVKGQEDQRITCPAAFKIAQEAGVSRKRIGEILNEMEIRICACQLGCFE